MTLPDWRIEKSAITASNMGHEVSFGGANSNFYSNNIFSSIYEINWSSRARRGLPFYWHSVKKQFDKVLRETKPDVIHAHNIFSAKMISEFGLPFVYDDHEYWPVYVIRQAEAAKHFREGLHRPRGGLPRKLARKIVRNFLMQKAIRLWTKWEKELVSSYPTITVSDQIAAELRSNYNAHRVFVVPNFPMKSEVKDFERPQFHSKLSCAYAGVEVQGEITPSHRNIDGFIEIFINNDIGHLTIIGWNNSSSAKVKYLGFLPRESMFKEMFKHSIGLIPFRKHWSHIYISPNKAYEYAHAGLFVITTSSFKPVKETLKEHCATFEDYNEMVSKLHYFKENLHELYTKRLKIYDYARNNLIWEKNEKNIITAYNIC